MISFYLVLQFNVKYWTSYIFENSEAQDAVIRAKGEMAELEELMDQAGLTAKGKFISELGLMSNGLV